MNRKELKRTFKEHFSDKKGEDKQIPTRFDREELKSMQNGMKKTGNNLQKTQS